MPNISFSRTHDEFVRTLRQKVDDYFIKNKLKQTGNWKLFSKTIILLLSISTMYVVLVFFTPPVWISLILCSLVGLNAAAIGFNVMHDGAHGSYSRKTWVNQLMSYTLDMLGGSSKFWKTKHNVVHHSFTNIDSHDEDIEIKPFMRLSEHQKKYWFHKYQHFYWWFFYCLTYFWWVGVRDFSKYKSRKIASSELPELKFKDHVEFWIGKVFYFTIFWVIPIYKLGFLNFAVGYGITLASAGLCLALIFQMAHVVEDLDFPKLGDDNKVGTAWVIHQLNTTSNFSTRSAFLRWFTGGLNFQVEHHLYPRMSHVHYPQISKIVKAVCQEYNVKYNEQRTFFSALKSHVLHLKRVGSMPAPAYN